MEDGERNTKAWKTMNPLTAGRSVESMVGVAKYSPSFLSKGLCMGMFSLLGKNKYHSTAASSELKGSERVQFLRLSKVFSWLVGGILCLWGQTLILIFKMIIFNLLPWPGNSG